MTTFLNSSLQNATLLNVNTDPEQCLYSVVYYTERVQAKRALIWATSRTQARDSVCAAIEDCAWVEDCDLAGNDDHREYAKNHDYV